MSREGSTNLPLASCVVLDLASEDGLLCGQLLANLGADVIKVERPGGDPARRKGPFYKNRVDPETSLFWLAYNTNKRGITLNIESAKGQVIFKKLVARADFLIESFPPGYMSRLGLGYPDLSKLNPRLIMTSITAYGQDGPLAHYKASDITLHAMSGFMNTCGDSDRPPLRFSLDQSYLHGALRGALGAMIAYHHRQNSGEGQHVDVSVQDCLVLDWLQSTWHTAKLNITRVGPCQMRKLVKRNVFRCKDGFISCGVQMGSMINKTIHIVNWMRSEGKDEGLGDIDWTGAEQRDIPIEVVRSWEAIMERFFLTHTKQELAQGAVQWDVMLSTVSDIRELVENKQLKERDFWESVPHPDLEDSILFPGKPFRAAALQIETTRRAPHVGEHNSAVYGALGFSDEELAAFREEAVI